MRQVFLVRHGMRQDMEDSAWRLTAKRPHDPPLSQTGMLQAREVGVYLRDKGIATMFCSPFSRAIQTAQMIYEQTGIRFRVEQAMGEWLNPKWFHAKPELTTLEEIQRECSGCDASYRSQTVIGYPEADEEIEVYGRVKQFLEWLEQEEPGNVVLVGHGATVTQAARALCGSKDGLDAKVGSITEIERVNGEWKSKGSTLQHLSIVIDK